MGGKFNRWLKSANYENKKEQIRLMKKVTKYKIEKDSIQLMAKIGKATYPTDIKKIQT